MHASRVGVTHVGGSLAAANSALLGHQTTADTSSADLIRSLLRIVADGCRCLAQPTSTLRLVCVDLSEGAHWASLLLLGVGVHQAVEVLGGSARSRALTLRSLDHPLVIWKLSSTTRLLTCAPRLGQKFVSFLEPVGADRLGVRELLL